MSSRLVSQSNRPRTRTIIGAGTSGNVNLVTASKQAPPPDAGSAS